MKRNINVNNTWWYITCLTYLNSTCILRMCAAIIPPPPDKYGGVPQRSKMVPGYRELGRQNLKHNSYIIVVYSGAFFQYNAFQVYKSLLEYKWNSRVWNFVPLFRWNLLKIYLVIRENLLKTHGPMENVRGHYGEFIQKAGPRREMTKKRPSTRHIPNSRAPYYTNYSKCPSGGGWVPGSV